MVILTDLSDVLIKGINEFGWTVAQQYGMDVGIECYKRFDETTEEFDNLLRGEITEEQFFDYFLSGIHFPLGKDSLKQVFSNGFKKEIRGTYDVYSRISAHPHSVNISTTTEGMPLIYIVSDHISEHIDEIMDYHSDIFKLTKGQIWSCNVGKIKRDPGFFPELLESLDLTPDKVVFVDDNFINVMSAIKAGIISIRFEDASQLEYDLTDLGFKFTT